MPGCLSHGRGPPRGAVTTNDYAAGRVLPRSAPGPDVTGVPVPDRLALFLIASAEAGARAALERVLRRAGFVVQGGAGEPSLELDYQAATFAIFNIVGDAAVAEDIQMPPDDGHRIPPPGAYAVIMAGVGERDSPDGVGTIRLDSDGQWLATVTSWLSEMGWTKEAE